MILRILAGVAVLYVLAIGYIYLTQDDRIFPIKHVLKEAPPMSDAISPLSLHVADGAVLEGVLKKDEEPNAPLILYFGGNGDDATHFAVQSPQGYDMIAFNYRGYVGSTGKPSEEALFHDALKIYDHYAKGRKVFVIGRSLGTCVATFLASKRVVDGLILITPYDSILSLAQRKYPLFPVAVLLNHPFETTRYMPFVSAPIGIIEVENDGMIPRYHLEKLLEAMPCEPMHVVLTQTTHQKVLDDPNFTPQLQILLGKMDE